MIDKTHLKKYIQAEFPGVDFRVTRRTSNGALIWCYGGNYLTELMHKVCEYLTANNIKPGGEYGHPYDPPQIQYLTEFGMVAIYHSDEPPTPKQLRKATAVTFDPHGPGVMRSIHLECGHVDRHLCWKKRMPYVAKRFRCNQCEREMADRYERERQEALKMLEG